MGEIRIDNQLMTARAGRRHWVLQKHADRIVYDKRTNNIAIRSRHDAQLMVLLKKKPNQSKLDEFDKYHLAAQLGFIHAIPEEEFNIATITIVDVTFLGFFPKRFSKH